MGYKDSKIKYSNIYLLYVINIRKSYFEKALLIYFNGVCQERHLRRIVLQRNEKKT